MLYETSQIKIRLMGTKKMHRVNAPLLPPGERSGETFGTKVKGGCELHAWAEGRQELKAAHWVCSQKFPSTSIPKVKMTSEGHTFMNPFQHVTLKKKKTLYWKYLKPSGIAALKVIHKWLSDASLGERWVPAFLLLISPVSERQDVQGFTAMTLEIMSLSSLSGVGTDLPHPWVFHFTLKIY